MKCQRCQNELHPHYNFCPVCGSQAKPACSHCRKDVNADWVNCPFCGANLKAPPIPPAGHSPVLPPPQYSKPRYHDRSNSSGNYHRRKKGFLDRFFS